MNEESKRSDEDIRLDILKMALEWVKHVGYSNNHMDVLKVADSFYSFVQYNINKI
jgi:hypothetical protein